MAEQGIPIIGPILNKIIGTRNERFVKKYTQRVRAINELEPQIRTLSDEELRSRTASFRERIEKGEKADDLMVDAFAVAREAMDRAVGIRNIFNPAANFDASKLPAPMQDLYKKLRAEADAMAPLFPRTQTRASQQPINGPAPEVDTKDEFLGHSDPIPGWRRIDIPVEMYEAVRELYPESRPPFRARPFDVQLIGGMVLTQGKIAEMKTGEGKTIVAPLATYLACLERLKVHVVTVNDYLVQRDRDWTFPFFRALGLTVGAIHPQHMQEEEIKRLMYRCDVVYGTTSEFGFDYLRDNMKPSVDRQVQRFRQFAIVDEVDSTLIDEARTPLIISGQAHDEQPRYELADQLAKHLVAKQRPWNEANEEVEKTKREMKGLEGDIRQARDKSMIPQMQQKLAEAKARLPQLEAARDRFTQYYEVKMERKSAHLTHDGVSEAQRAAGIGSFYVDQNIDMPHLLEQSVRAHVVYENDKDYVIAEVDDPMMGRRVPSIVIVDPNTGRPMIGRQWSDGLHQAIECKEKVPIKKETQTVATVTIQNFFKMYKRLAGMTGTADTEAQEFHDIYKLDVVSIPTNKPVIRRDFDDLVFLSAKDKWSKIVDEIKTFHDAGRPVLVGTTSVEKSQMLSQMLTRTHGVQHEVLNAKQHEREAHIVENAGQLGAVMIATNMAGRGTDIKLGKITRASLLDHWLKRGIAPRTVTPDSSEEELREGVYRKIAPQELGRNRRETDEMPFEELELALLRHWAVQFTQQSERSIANARADELREALDAEGRCLLHRIRWFESVEDLGGLHVVGTERHESRRIDNQLRGRSGRQGDNGSSRFFVSLEDDLMKMFAGETTMKVLARMGMKEGEAIQHPMLTKSVERAQRKVEERNFQMRKHILEYDEIMEHQRQTFYGIRQRILDGRDVKGLIFDWIRRTVDDAVEEYLDVDYAARCAAEYASAKLECSIPPDRLRGRELDEMEMLVTKEAKEEARHTISVTLGEYMPLEGSEVAIDFDSAGLINWAKSRFGVELDSAELREGGAAERKRVQNMLNEAAEDAIDRADLSGLATYVDPDYGAKELSAWVKRKLDLEVPYTEIQAAQKKQTDDGDDDAGPTALLMRRVEEAYERREVEFPVEYAMNTTQQLAAQVGLKDAAQHLLAWSNRRYRMGWDETLFKTHTPPKVREELLKASREFIESNKLDEELDKALEHKGDLEALDRYMRERFDRGITDQIRYAARDDRENAIRSMVESILRAELLAAEREILLTTMDSAWKDHLYSMDQLRDTVNFRAFSQQDPRIEYKREGSALFTTFMEGIRERTTEYIFKARLAPPQMPMRRPAPPRQQSMQMGGISGPGISGAMSGPEIPGAAGAPPQGGGRPV